MTFCSRCSVPYTPKTKETNWQLDSVCESSDRITNMFAKMWKYDVRNLPTFATEIDKKT